jgi:hypothetical protein
MTFNNAPIVHVLGNILDNDQRLLRAPIARRRVVSDACLPERLPSNGRPNRALIVLVIHVSSRVYGARG